MKKLLPVLLLALFTFSCKKDDPEKDPEGRLYPIQITRTASYTSDVEVLKYTYNAQQQLIKEELSRNNIPERYSLFSYTAAGKLHFKRVYNSENRFLEQDELFYSAGNVLQSMQHAYIDSAGTPALHHIRTYTFDAEGKINRWTDLAPDRSLVSSRTYQYKENNVVESAGTGNLGQFQDKIVVFYDGKRHPFVNTGIYPIRFAGNETQMQLQNETGQVVSSYIIEPEYNTEGYLVKRTQTLDNGAVITETYLYKTE